MERNSEILRRDARAPLCLDPLPRWRYEHVFLTTLREFISADSELLSDAVNFLAAHHAYAQEFVNAVDVVIVAEDVSLATIRRSLVSLLVTCRRLRGLEGRESILERTRETLAEKFQTDEGTLPEFCWEKGAASLFFESMRRARVDSRSIEEEISVHIDDVYDDCARTVQLGLWIMAASWRAEVVDTWLFESAYAFFHHTLPQHINGPGGLVAALPKIIGGLHASSE